MNLQALCSYVLDQVQVYEFYRSLQFLQNVKNEINYQKTSKYMQLRTERGKPYPRTATVILYDTLPRELEIEKGVYRFQGVEIGNSTTAERANLSPAISYRDRRYQKWAVGNQKQLKQG